MRNGLSRSDRNLVAKTADWLAKEEAIKTGMDSLKVGDIFVSEFGYSMSLVSFYMVVRKTAKQVVLSPMKTFRDRRGCMGGEFIATPVDGSENLEVQTRHKVRFDLGSPCVSISSCQTAFLWDGKPRSGNDWD